MNVQSSRLSGYLLWVAIPILSTVYQACIKLFALQMHDMSFGWLWLMKASHSPLAIIIILAETVSFALWLTILSDTSLSKAAPVTAVAYLMILLVSWFCFKEQVVPLQVFGSGLILAGVWLIGSTKAEAV